jgi:hypothetical protein
MLYSEIIAVCSEIHTKHINTLCGQNVEYVDVNAGGTQLIIRLKVEVVSPVNIRAAVVFCNSSQIP